MRGIRSFPVFFLTVALCGCAGYKLGPSNGQTAGEKSIQIVPFTNKTMEPRVGDAVTFALRKEVQRDGTFRLATHDAGDLVVTGTITRFNRYEVSYLPSDVLTVADYLETVTARVTARERSTGKVVFDQPVSGHGLVQVGSDLTSAERQALPLLADDLAKNVTALLANGTW